MKRLSSRDGYALVYVVAVLTLIMLLAGGISLTATRNLKSQEAAVEQMRARYAAAGDVERVFAGIGEFENTIKSSPNPEPSEEEINEFVVKKMRELFGYSGTLNMEAQTISFTVVRNVEGATVNADITAEYSVNMEAQTISFTVVVSVEGATVNAEIRAEYSVNSVETPPGEGETPPEGSAIYKHTFNIKRVRYASYNVDYGSGEAET